MRIRDGIALVAILSGFGAADAMAAPESAYVGAGGGVVILPEQSLENHVDIESDKAGWLAAGTLGLRWTSGWRVELEGAYRRNTSSIPGIGGKISSESLAVNALRNLDMGWKVIPYVGAGIGVARVKYDFDIAGSDEKGTGGLWQLIGGATLPVCDRFELFADYRYFDTFAVNADLGGVGVHDNYHGHSFMGGFRVTFWKSEAEPVAAAPAPAPVAAPKDYVVYFEFNKADVTQAAGAVLDELKATSGGSAVSVVGHTDTSGSAEYNQRLSERRATNTGKALEARSVKVDSVTGKGFTEPAVNTGPGVKEPLNRRAVIKLSGPAAPSQ